MERLTSGMFMPFINKVINLIQAGLLRMAFSDKVRHRFSARTDGHALVKIRWFWNWDW